MCNRARNLGEPETLIERFGGGWLTDKPMDNRFNPVELVPRGRAYVIRREAGANGLDVMSWDLLGNGAAYPITNVRDLKRGDHALRNSKVDA
jgi:putative SOS response-associated peptidase YedK